MSFAAPLVRRLLKHARYLGAATLFLVLPIAGRASIIMEEIDFSVNGLNGDAVLTVDTSQTLNDFNGTTGGNYADPNDGLLSLNVTYNGANYTMADFLDFNAMPIVLLPGNASL
jgi:hypothetical protein